MSTHEPIRRWSEGGAATAEEQRAAKLLASSRNLPPLPPEAVVRVEAGISTSLAATGVAAWVKVTLASVALVTGGGTAALISLRDPAPVHAEPPAVTRTPEPVVAEVLAAPVPENTVRPEPVSARPQAESRPRRPSSRPEAPSALARESSLLEAALSHLDRNEPDRALTVLDAYAREFPKGQLASEARVARIDALVATGRRTDALKLLENDDDLPRASELRVLRAELLAEAGDCRRALGDFEDALRAYPRGPLASRALRGRGNCRLALGDVEGGETDLRESLKK